MNGGFILLPISDIHNGETYIDRIRKGLMYRVLSYPYRAQLEVHIEMVASPDSSELGNKHIWAESVFRSFALPLGSIPGNIPKKIVKELKCECGAAKAGYTKPGRAHSHSYCPMYKE